MLNFSCILVCLFTPIVDEQDNPEYKQWAKFKPGTTVTVKMVTESAGMNQEMVTTTTLKSVSDSELVLESKMTMNVAGQKIEPPPTDRKVMAKIPKIDGPKVEDKDMPKPKVEEGTEDVEIAGKKVSCKWTKTIFESEGGKSETKMWMCESIPGGMAKMESKTSGEVDSTMKSVVTSYETK